MRTGTRRREALCTVLLSLAVACQARGEDLLAAAAVSLREPLTEIAQRYEEQHPADRVRISFGASSFLAAQIRAGAPVDVFCSADERIVDGLVAEGLVEADGHAPLATNRLVVLVAREADFPLERPEDLVRPAIRRVAMPDGAVPVGRYAREWLAARGLLAPLETRIVRTEHARATLAAVDLGHVDVAIVYATDARVARSARLAFEVPQAEQPRIAYVAARVAGAQPSARRFFAFLGGAEARRALTAAGFGAP